MSKILKKRINIKRKESLNKKLLTQVIFSIILVLAVIATKQYGNDYVNIYLKSAGEKLNETFDFDIAFSNIKSFFSNFGNGFKLGFLEDDGYSAPVSGKILKNYSEDTSDESSEYANGIDIISNMEAVKAISSGKVASIGNNKKMSNYIVVESGNKKFIYAKFEEIFVSKGDEIKVGEIIGRLNSENRVLHVEIWENGKSINPSDVFKLHD